MINLEEAEKRKLQHRPLFLFSVVSEIGQRRMLMKKLVFYAESILRQHSPFLDRVSEHGLDKAGNFGEPEFTFGK